jgi:hypothetical protein
MTHTTCASDTTRGRTQIASRNTEDAQQPGDNLGQLHRTLLVGGTGRFRSNAESLRRGRTMRPKSNAPR